MGQFEVQANEVSYNPVFHEDALNTGVVRSSAMEVEIAECSFQRGQPTKTDLESVVSKSMNL
jgi:hypothetical protein